jgi:hypothetical protein
MELVSFPQSTSKSIALHTLLGRPPFDWCHQTGGVIDPPNKIDFDMATLNLRSSRIPLTREASLWPDLANASAKIVAGSQQLESLDNDGPTKQHDGANKCIDSTCVPLTGTTRRTPLCHTVLVEHTVDVFTQDYSTPVQLNDCPCTPQCFKMRPAELGVIRSRTTYRYLLSLNALTKVWVLTVGILVASYS